MFRKTMHKYRTLSNVTEGYYLNNPHEINGFLKITFEESAEDNDIGALLSALRIISRIKDIGYREILRDFIDEGACKASK